MAKFDWKETLGAVAPTIGTLLGGPLGGAAALAIAKALDLSDTSEQTLQAAITGADPADLAKLKSADRQFAAQMKELDIKLEEVHQKDRHSAREMAMDKGLWVQTALVILLTMLFCYVLLELIGGTQIPDSTKSVVIYAMGTLNGLLIQAYNFFFGTSKGSKDKADQLERAMK